jgi:hypothetical protein
MVAVHTEHALAIFMVRLEFNVSLFEHALKFIRVCFFAKGEYVVAVVPRVNKVIRPAHDESRMQAFAKVRRTKKPDTMAGLLVSISAFTLQRC